MQEIGIEKTLLQAVLEGTKTIEGRLGKPKYLKLRVGDKLSLRKDIWENDEIVQSTSNVATVIITQLLYFESFAEMLNSINYAAAIPGAENPDEALGVYEKLYSAEDEMEYGVVAITFNLSALPLQGNHYAYAILWVWHKKFLSKNYINSMLLQGRCISRRELQCYYLANRFCSPSVATI